MIPRPTYFAAPGFIASYKLPGKEYEAQNIINIVADYYRVEARKLSWRTRVTEILTPRQVAMFFIRKYTTLTVLNIGILFKRHHTSVLNSLTQVDNLMATDEQYRERVQHLTNILLEM
jgi:chromosomal replication initiation ATPase DnaA